VLKRDIDRENVSPVGDVMSMIVDTDDRLSHTDIVIMYSDRHVIWDYHHYDYHYVSMWLYVMIWSVCGFAFGADWFKPELSLFKGLDLCVFLGSGKAL